uniref:Regulator of telomere elongation helicase 1 n=1 Tax=Echeneis naucrates TaxID=173247 RepID=A0A665WFC2_ECHNA
MTSLSLRGVTVHFPFPPYDCQREYMGKVIECLQTEVNGVLESPTGTGKTLCLLCATLAWREHFKDTISAHKITERLGGDHMFPNSSWGTTAADDNTPTHYTDVPKIIYASRTHSQLAQVISELKNTSYRPKVCVLGSREQLCINQEVMRQESNHVKVHMCRAKVSTRSCVFYNNVEERSTDRDLVNSILDVEDLVKFGNKQRACPYYLSRSLKQQADIIFMPYNYLLDPKSCRAHNIELKGAVVIFDEAHNVEKVCEESTSFDLTPYDLASAITAVDKLLLEQAKEVHHSDSEAFNSESLSSAIRNQLVFICMGTSAFTSMCLAQVHIHKDTSSNRKKQSSDMWTSSSSKKQGNVLSYWCFSPGFSMQDLVNQGVRCIILTSGTLSPLTSFTSEMRIKFPVCLENSHVIERDQIFVSIIDQGPDGVGLSSAFDRRFVPENMASLGNTVANLSRVVPYGLLVFFPSFSVMEKTLDFWRTNGHADRIEKIKPMFVEPKGKGTFNEVMDGYYDKVNDPVIKGGSFFAVCRGKASEGLDFANTFGRGVIITGLPFPPKMDPRVILKMQFLDEMSRKKTDGYLSGQEWYRQQAFRAVNQAIGRVIRHKEDYGAIFLCDQRFKNSDARAQLPSWVRPYVRLYDGFGNIIRDVSQFFRVSQKLRPVVMKENHAERCDTVCLPDSQSSGFTHCSSTQRSSTQQAKMLDTHLPSLKRRRLSEYESKGRICIEYDCEVQESQRRPHNLLDALERGEYCRADDNDAVEGEEKTKHFSTSSLVYDKRMDDELRGGKRKIKLVQEQVCVTLDCHKIKMFLAEMKKSLSQVNFDRIIQALQSYKKTDDVDLLLTETTVLTEDRNTHSLLRGLYQFVRPHHKKRFDERCQELTGQGCGYKPSHSLSKDEMKALMIQTVWLVSSSCASIGDSFFVSERSAQLFETIQSYKKTNNYENLVTTVVSMFTERHDDFQFLHSEFLTFFCTDVHTCVLVSALKSSSCLSPKGFGVFIRPQHKKQYKEMLDGLTGQSVSTALDVTTTCEDQWAKGE